MNKFYRKNRDKKKYFNLINDPKPITANSCSPFSSRHGSQLDHAIRSIDGFCDLVGNGDFADHGVTKSMTMNMYD